MAKLYGKSTIMGTEPSFKNTSFTSAFGTLLPLLYTLILENMMRTKSDIS
jgi:hypothetical protein